MTALGQINAGGRILASLARGIAPLAAYKGADEPVASSTTLQNDDALFVPVAANATYLVLCFIDYEGNTNGSGDFKTNWTVPAGATLKFTNLGLNGSGSIATPSVVASPTPAFTYATAGAGTTRGIIILGTLATGGTAGTLQLQWCQNVSNATATIVHAGSVLALWQIA